MRLNKRSNLRSGSLGTAIFLTFFGGFFGGLPLMGVMQEWKSSNTNSWIETPCVFEQSALKSENGKPALALSYQYDWLGVTRVSETISATGNHYDSQLAAKRDLERWQPGSRHKCYVNPEPPYSAVLRQTGSHINLAEIGFFSIFIFIGFGLIIGGWASYFRRNRNPNAPSAPSRSNHSHSGKLAGILFSFLFMAIGLGVTYALLVRPILAQRASVDWIQVPATIISSEVGEHRGDDSTTYSVDIHYSYSYEEKPYTSDRYAFSSGGSSSGRGAKQQIVNKYPAGKEITIFINPLKPFDAVIIRELTNDIWFGLIPLVFFFAGLAALIATLRSGRRGSAPRRNKSSSSRAASAQGKISVSSGSSRFKKMLFILFFALFWNGFIGTFFAVTCIAEDSSIGAQLFLIPFALVGLGLIAAVIHQLLALKNPTISLHFDRSELALGDRATARLEVKGKIARVKTISITLRGQEEATYRCGTRSVTRKNTFFEDDLLQMDMATGFQLPPSLDLSIPANSMHSFKASHNTIHWQLVIKGDIPKWPDIKDEIELQIMPRRN